MDARLSGPSVLAALVLLSVVSCAENVKVQQGRFLDSGETFTFETISNLDTETAELHFYRLHLTDGTRCSGKDHSFPVLLDCSGGGFGAVKSAERAKNSRTRMLEIRGEVNGRDFVAYEPF